MATEKEIWSKISEENFKLFLRKIETKLGKPKHTKRVSLQATDYNR